MIALALLGGVVLVVVFAGMAVLAFFMWKAKSVAEANAARLDATLAGNAKELRTTLDIHEAFMSAWTEDATEAILSSSKSNESVHAEMKALAESFKSSLTGARTETRNTNNDFIKKLAEILKTQHDEMKTITASINGERLQDASVKAIKACLAIEKLVATLHGMLLTHNEREASPSDLGAEEYAPDSAGTIYDQNPTARQDALFDREEAEETLTA